MMLVKAGSTDVTTYFHLRLAASGLDATGLTISDVDMQYTRSGVAPTAKVDAVALAATDTAHTDNRGIEIDATDQPGLYRFDWPDAAFAAGVREVLLTIKVATAFTETLRVQIVGYDPADGVRLGLTALPNAAADAAGGLPISDAGGLNLDGLAFVGSAMTLTSGERNAIADADNARVVTEAYAADGAAATKAQLLYMIYGLLANFAFTGTAQSVKKLDKTTQAMAFALDDENEPTSHSRTA